MDADLRSDGAWTLEGLDLMVHPKTQEVAGAHGLYEDVQFLQDIGGNAPHACGGSCNVLPAADHCYHAFPSCREPVCSVSHDVCRLLR
ncbi:MAG: hypothetical protein LBF74_04300 [Treponema sp.]|nr:hypothetical protein [Treponema sp.]